MSPEELAGKILSDLQETSEPSKLISNYIFAFIRQAVEEERKANEDIAERIAFHYFSEHFDPDLDIADRTKAYAACDEIVKAIRSRSQEAK